MKKLLAALVLLGLIGAGVIAWLAFLPNVPATEDDAERLETFFADLETVYSDMDQAHSAEAFPEHEVEYLDLFTHANDIRGYLRFSTWGVPVEGGRVLSEDLVELSLGDTVNSRIQFAASREALQ